MRISTTRVLAVVGQAAIVAMSWTACNNGDNNGSDAAPDVTATDVKPDKSAPDVMQPDVNTSCEVAVPSSNVNWAPARAINPMGCSAQEISDYDTICINGTNTSACTSWQTAHATCYGCLYSNDTDSSYGPVVATASGYIYANAGGCVALLTGDNTKTGCGAALWQTSDCEDHSCGMCPDQNTYNACISTADTDPMACQSFHTAGNQDNGTPAGTACASIDAGSIAACDFSASSFDEFYTAVATVMCGGYAADAGTPDASTDAPADAPDGD